MTHKLRTLIQRQGAKLGEFLAPDTEDIIAGLWSEEAVFLKAAFELKKKGYKNLRALTPFPVHGLEEALSIKRSWIPWVTFIFGLGGCVFGLWFTWWTSAVSWPLIVGGKPLWSLPAFVPVIFECTILVGALASVGALFYALGLPSFNPPVLHKDLSSHKFALFFKQKDKKHSTEEIHKVFKELGAEDILNTRF